MHKLQQVKVQIILFLYAITKALPFVLTTKCYRTQYVVLNLNAQYTPRPISRVFLVSFIICLVICYSNTGVCNKTKCLFQQPLKDFEDKSCAHYDQTIFTFFCWHKLKIQLQERNQNTTNTGEPTQPEWKSRNNAHMRSNLSITIKLLGVILRPLTPQIELNSLRTSWQATSKAFSESLRVHFHSILP